MKKYTMGDLWDARVKFIEGISEHKNSDTDMILQVSHITDGLLRWIEKWWEKEEKK